MTVEIGALAVKFERYRGCLKMGKDTKIATETIYGLLDPRTGELRYIGKTQNVHERYRHHLRSSSSLKSHKASWIKSLSLLSLSPELIVLEHLPSEDINEAESFYIGYFRSLGARLTNLTEGGDGAKHTLESRQKIRDGMSSPEVREKVSRNAKALMLIPSHRQRSLSNLAKATAMIKKRIWNSFTGEIYSSVEEAARVLALSPTHLSAFLRGKYPGKYKKKHLFQYNVGNTLAFVFDNMPVFRRRNGKE